MSAREPWTGEFESYAAFYRAEYGQYLSMVRAIGSLGVTVLEAHQTAGDWSDAPTPELTVSWSPTMEAEFTCDLGAGRFSAKLHGSPILTPPYTATTILAGGAHTVRAIAVPYTALSEWAGEAASALPTDGDFAELHSGSIEDRSFGAIRNAIWEEAIAGAPHGSLLIDGLVLQLVGTLLRLRDGAEAAGRWRGRGGLAPWQIRRVREFIEHDVAGSPTLGDLASLVRLSPFHFARAFRNSTGRPPHAYLRQVRCEEACRYLTATNLTVGEIAAKVGYETPQAFARMFRAEVGASPTEYRRERRS